VGNEAVVVTLDGEWSDSEAEAAIEDKAYVKVMGISSGQVGWSFIVHSGFLTIFFFQSSRSIWDMGRP